MPTVSTWDTERDECLNLALSRCCEIEDHRHNGKRDGTLATALDRADMIELDERRTEYVRGRARDASRLLLTLMAVEAPGLVYAANEASTGLGYLYEALDGIRASDEDD